MPSSDDENKQYLRNDTAELKLISDYTGFDFNEVRELDCYTYRCLLRDALTHKHSQSKDGREYLEQCWILQQATPQRDKLQEKWGEQKQEKGSDI